MLIDIHGEFPMKKTRATISAMLIFFTLMSCDTITTFTYDTDIRIVRNLFQLNGISDVEPESRIRTSFSSLGISGRRVTRIDLSSLDLTSLVLPSDFDDLDKVTSINLARNYLATIPVEIFTASLESLWVGSNRLCDFPFDQEPWNTLIDESVETQLCISTDTYKRDSVCVRHLLDTNGYHEISVQSVTSVYNNRIVELDLSEMDLIVMPGDCMTGLSALKILRGIAHFNGLM